MEVKIKIIDNGICVDIKKLKEILTYKWQKFYRFYYKQGQRGEDLYNSILGRIADCAHDISYEMRKVAQEYLELSHDLEWSDLYTKSDIRSIGFEVLNFLQFIWPEAIEVLTKDDIPAILEFLDTPSDKSLEAWDRWEKYWENLDYPERRKKLLEDPKYNYRTVFHAPINIECQGDIEKARNLLYALTKEFAHKKLVAQGNEVVQNNKLRIFYQCESGIRMQLSPSGNFDITIDGLNKLHKAIEEKIKNSKNSDHPRVITDIIKNI